MRKASLVTFSAGAGVFTLMSSVPAHADIDYAGQATAQLASQHVYVDPGATLGSQGQISSDLNGENVAIAVFPEDAASTVSPNALASQIKTASAGQYETVIVVIDGASGARDSFGVASNNDSVRIATTLNGNNAGDGGQAILASIDEITRSETVTSTETNSTPDVPGNDDGLGVVGGASIVLALAAIGTFGTIMYRRMRGTITKNTTTSITYDQLPEDLRRVLQEYRVIVMKHSTASNQALSRPLQSILANVQELFRRIDKRGNAQAKRMASVEYVETFKKLNKALGEDYYLDIASHPHLWDDATERMSVVRDAVMATDATIVKNIRQVNASQDLDFKVALESLTRSMDTPTVKEIYSTKKDENYS